MCGIAGVIHSDPCRPVHPENIRAMCDALVHRGPDHFGYRVEGQMGFGMRRLSIIDLQTGEQPIANEDSTIWIVFNGEIYNYRELRREMEQKGHQFRTSSDTEAIVHLYEELGDNCVRRLRGMFAFAIWDSNKRRMLLARDRLGIKPLYYVETSGGLLFGSEIKALLTQPSTSQELSVEAIWEYFTHLCVPGDLSIFHHIKKLPPAHTLAYQNGQSRLCRYWHIQPCPDTDLTEGQWIESLQAKLKSAVESHMVADVPVGAFLSGGLDSGAMVALMAGVSQSPVRTYTVGFDSEVGRFDEREAAQTVALRYETDHHECLLKADVCEILPKIVAAFDEPFADSSSIPNWLVCSETSQHVKVALSGLGADELFGGYERYLGLQLGEAYRRIPRQVRRLIMKVGRTLPAGNGISHNLDRLKRFLSAGDMMLADRYRSFIVAFPDACTILHPDLAESLKLKSHRYDQIISEIAIAKPLDLALFADLYLYLPDDLLPLSDRISMAHSLEVRVPFLDHELVEFAAKIPARFKVRNLQKKYLFRKAISSWLPPEHFSRPKQGFSVPVAAWLRGPLRPMLYDLVNSRKWRTSEWLNHAAIQKIVDAHLSGQENHESQLWALLCFQEWHQQLKGLPTVVSV